MAVFPESLDRLDPKNTEESIEKISEYIRYMTERTEFAMRNVTRNVSEAGVSSTDVYMMLLEQQQILAALQSSVAKIQGDLTELFTVILPPMQDSLAKLDEEYAKPTDPEEETPEGKE